MMKAKITLLEGAMKIIPGALAVLIAMSVAAGRCAAEDRDHSRGVKRGGHEVWRGDIHRFHEYDFGLWQGGRWHHGWHRGRKGWWWIVGGIWYFYPAPVYPYPNPYEPPMVPAPPAPSAAQYWYYCSNPPGYYPYVARCRTNWQPVPANPPPAVPR